MKKKILFPLILTLLLSSCGPITDPTNPTSNPTVDPTVEPTVDPTEDPTTIDPTVDPTIDPTTDPTEDPTTVIPPSTEDPTIVVPPTTEDPTTVVPPSKEDPTTVVPPSTEDPTTVIPPTTVPTTSPTTTPEPTTYTVKMSSFSSTSGNIGGDSNITYTSYKGGGTTDPAIYNNVIRLYQHASGKTGGYITLAAKSGISILEAKIGTDMDTTIAYSLDTNTAMSSSETLKKGSVKTVSNLDNSSITFYCLGTTKSQRLYVNYLEVTYTGGEPSKPTVPPTTTPTTSPTTQPSTNTTPVVPGGDNYDGTYYNSLDMNQSANALLGDLRDLIVDTHTKYTSYDDCAAGSSNVQKADGDPNNSKNVIMLYCRRSMPNVRDYNVWNREHVWPKSTGLWETSGGGSDLHHIRPSISSINSTRGNKVFGEVTNGTAVSSDGYVGGHYSGNTFEPIDAAKGDVARIIMYMFVHYNSPSHIESNTNKTGSVNSTETCTTSGNLPLTNVIYGTKADAFKLILKWHNEDPVDALEIQRNEAVYKIQGNRNPFIDIPSLADTIWG